MNLKCFLVVTICISIAPFGFAQSEFDAPELKSAESPAAIPEDHKAILESEKIVSRVNSDEYFLYVNQVKVAKLKEMIALARKGEAEANALACKASPTVCKTAGVAVSAPVAENDKKSTDEKDKEVQSIKEAQAQAKLRNAIAAEKNKLSAIKLSAVSNGEAIINYQGETITLPVGGQHDGFKLTSISHSSVQVRGLTMGQIRTVGMNGMNYFPTGHIKPIPKDNEVKPEI